MTNDVYQYTFMHKIGDNHKPYPVSIISSDDIKQAQEKYNEYSIEQDGIRFISPFPRCIREKLPTRLEWIILGE